MKDLRARKVRKACPATMASPAPKASPGHPEPMGRLDQPDLRVRKAGRVTPVYRRVRKALKETTGRPVLRVRQEK